MNKFKKENHIEFSDGDTDFIAVRECPLTDKQIEEETHLLSDSGVVCCRNSDKNHMCSDFYGFLLTDKGVITIQCASMRKVKEERGSPEPVEIEMVSFWDKIINTLRGSA